MTTIAEWFFKGGWIMWPLLALSILVMGVTLERSLFFLLTYTPHRKILKRLPKMFQAVKSTKDSIPFSKSRSPSGQIALVYLDHLHYPEEQRNKVLRREGDRLVAELSRHSKLLASIAHAAPLIGLLGTVTGLVAAFYKIELLGGKVVPADLAGGIWEALITTVAGLGVGIPAMLIYQFFQARSDTVCRQMSEVVSELDEIYFCDQFDRNLTNIASGKANRRADVTSNQAEVS